MLPVPAESSLVEGPVRGAVESDPVHESLAPFAFVGGSVGPRVGPDAVFLPALPAPLVHPARGPRVRAFAVGLTVEPTALVGVAVAELLVDGHEEVVGRVVGVGGAAALGPVGGTARKVGKVGEGGGRWGRIRAGKRERKRKRGRSWSWGWIQSSSAHIW